MSRRAILLGIVTLKISYHFDYIYVYIKIIKVLHYTIR